VNRRELLKKAIPVAALTPLAVAEGISRYNLEPAGHFLFIVDIEKVDIASLFEYPSGMLPAGSKGGWIIGVNGNPDEAMKILRLDDEQAEEIMGRVPDIKT
jgi:hypothetical protein